MPYVIVAGGCAINVVVCTTGAVVCTTGAGVAITGWATTGCATTG